MELKSEKVWLKLSNIHFVPFIDCVKTTESELNIYYMLYLPKSISNILFIFIDK